MSETIQLRQVNPDVTNKMARFDEDDVYGYLSREVAERLGEFIEVTVSEEAEVNARQSGTTTNYTVFETPGEAVVGFGVSKEILSDVAGDETPDSIGLNFSESDEDTYEEATAEETDEEEIEGLIAGSDDSEDDSEEEEEVEISDEELDLVDAE